MKKNILIIGNNLGAESFAKIFCKDFNVFITSGNKKLSDIATCIDIRSNNIVELLDFALTGFAKFNKNMKITNKLIKYFIKLYLLFLNKNGFINFWE